MRDSPGCTDLADVKSTIENENTANTTVVHQQPRSDHKQREEPSCFQRAESLPDIIANGQHLAIWLILGGDWFMIRPACAVHLHSGLNLAC